MAKFQIPAENLVHLDTVLEKINKKARKLKCIEATTNIVGFIPATFDRDGNQLFAAYYDIEVVGFAPVIPGWSFMGTIEHTEAGNILRSVPGNEIPETFRTAKANCDHCKVYRSRKDTYVVKNEAGEVKQVGHNCVQDYLPGVTPEQLAFAAQWVKEIRELCSEGFEGGRSASGVELTHFIAVAAEMVLTEGYRAAAHPDGSTGKSALHNIQMAREWAKNESTRKLIVYPTARAHALAEEAIAWRTANKETPFELNQAIALENPIVPLRNTGLVASVLFSYQRAMDLLKAKEIKVPVAPSSFFGEVKKRYDLILTLTKKLSFEGEMGTYYILLFKDEAGNVFKWGTGNGYNLYEGSQYKVRGTVKKHETYRDVNQTTLTRCKLEDLRQLTIPATMTVHAGV